MPSTSRPLFLFIENLHLKASKTYVRVASFDVPLTLLQKKNILKISGKVVRTPNPLNLEIEIYKRIVV